MRNEMQVSEMEGLGERPDARDHSSTAPGYGMRGLLGIFYDNSQA
jgi:hypothetical protein